MAITDAKEKRSKVGGGGSSGGGGSPREKAEL